MCAGLSRLSGRACASTFPQVLRLRITAILFNPDVGIPKSVCIPPGLHGFPTCLTPVGDSL